MSPSASAETATTSRSVSPRVSAGAASLRPQTDSAPTADAAAQRPLPITAVVMLAGSVRANHLRRATGRSPLEMPLSSSRTVLDAWLEQVEALGRLQHVGRGGEVVQRLPVRVMIDQDVALEAGDDAYEHLEVTVERDPSALRGTAGLLHDIARSYRDDDRLLVLHGSQVPFQPLDAVVRGLGMPGEDGRDADISLVCDVDGSPAGVMALRCGALRDISPVGYVDLNEQALPRIAKGFDVRVRRSDRRVTRSIRTLSGYLDTLRAYSRREAGRLVEADPYAEDWQASFQITEGGAAIDESAVIHDSVVLAGARVDAGAVVVRSVICPGTVVARGQSVVDSVAS